MAGKDEFNDSNDETRIPSPSSISKKSTGIYYLSFDAKKAFNHLWQVFTQASIIF